MAPVETEERPWGRFVVLSDAPDHKVKQIVVHPGLRLSYQLHKRRSEHWFIVSGHGEVVLDDVARRVGPGDTVDVPVGVAHRISCTGDANLVFIEIQHGEYFGEDDIVRLQDDFGRVG